MCVATHKDASSAFLRSPPLPQVTREQEIFDVSAAPFGVDLASPKSLIHFALKPVGGLGYFSWAVRRSLQPINRDLNPLDCRWHSTINIYNSVSLCGHANPTYDSHINLAK